MRNGANGLINTGNGNDVVKGVGNRRQGIVNFGIIKTGSGDDVVTGYSTDSTEYGIRNTGLIDTGSGNDVVDAGIVGFEEGAGVVILGDGHDVLKGFGTGLFDSERGSDMLQLWKGVSTIEGSKITHNEINMNAVSIEKIG